MFAVILIFVLSGCADDAYKAKYSELPLLAAIEYETQRSTFLEAEIIAQAKEKPSVAPHPAETAEATAPKTPEEPPEATAETEEDKAALEPLILKKFISLASDPPPTEPPTDPPPPPELKPQTPTEPPPPPPPLIHNDGNEKFLVISFDDGPGPHTERLLDILAKNNAKATFFVVGYKVASYAETIKHMVEQGHEVAGHSWNHPRLTSSGSETIKWELQATNDAIYEVTGITPKFYRAPYGSYNDNVKNISKQLGLSLIQWNIDVLDWKLRNADAVYKNIMTMAKDGGVICVHDVHSTTVDAMERAIPDLIASGYTLLTVSEMFGAMEPGLVYYNRGYWK